VLAEDAYLLKLIKIEAMGKRPDQEEGEVNDGEHG